MTVADLGSRPEKEPPPPPKQTWKPVSDRTPLVPEVQAVGVPPSPAGGVVAGICSPSPLLVNQPVLDPPAVPPADSLISSPCLVESLSTGTFLAPPSRRLAKRRSFPFLESSAPNPVLPSVDVACNRFAVLNLPTASLVPPPAISQLTLLFLLLCWVVSSWGLIKSSTYPKKKTDSSQPPLPNHLTSSHPSVCLQLYPPSSEPLSQSGPVLEPDLALVTRPPSLSPPLANSPLSFRPHSSLRLSSPLPPARGLVSPSRAGILPIPSSLSPSIPRGSNLLNRYSLAKSVASSSLIVNPSSSLTGCDGALFSPPSPIQPNPFPLTPTPLPLASSGSFPVGHEGTIVNDTGSDYEDTIPFEDPVYLDKIELLNNAGSDEDRVAETNGHNRTKFHWEGNSPPRLFRKTPRRS